MLDAVKAADRIELDVLGELESLYPEAIKPVLQRHAATLERYEALQSSGADGRARVMLRRSKLVDDLAKALAAAGVKAADLIRGEIAGVKEAAHESEETG